ncbi:GTP cyclohydrolase FolE2 [Pseudomonas sp.]|uniref:GTP cyclohydrolase FolE2 n=1 Tax=Pseudomonas sp. TaxID=306 RepID=UPI002898DD3C|nr:GTP cyclohydrolase FolE2 [Pseudomonas sp.]
MILPDIAAQMDAQALPLDWVGMQGIALPVTIEGHRVSARASAGVNLVDGRSRGIHMSRLYLALQSLEQDELSPLVLRRLLSEFLDTHEGLSTAAHCSLSFDYLVNRPALISSLAGWKSYPVTVDASIKNEMFHVELFVRIAYSSTCPCSAALARQLIQQQFLDDFAGVELQQEAVLAWLGSSEGIVATPHSQRSEAHIKMRLATSDDTMPFRVLIDSTEAALGTAVQTAVKRADEQAFALANGQNLMFCEDAARRLHVAMQALPWANGFSVRVEHAESLHAHDAVAVSEWRW